MHVSSLTSVLESQILSWGRLTEINGAFLLLAWLLLAGPEMLMPGGVRECRSRKSLTSGETDQFQVMSICKSCSTCCSFASPLVNHEEGSQLLRFAMQSLPSTHCIRIQNEMGLIADHRYSPFLVPGERGG